MIVPKVVKDPTKLGLDLGISRRLEQQVTTRPAPQTFDEAGGRAQQANLREQVFLKGFGQGYGLARQIVTPQIRQKRHFKALFVN